MKAIITRLVMRTMARYCRIVLCQDSYQAKVNNETGVKVKQCSAMVL